MPINDVVQLFSTVDESAGLRKDLNNCTTAEDVNKLLSSAGFMFTPFEFEDAVRMMQLKCQSEEDAMFVLEKAMWLRYLLKIQED